MAIGDTVVAYTTLDHPDKPLDLETWLWSDEEEARSNAREGKGRKLVRLVLKIVEQDNLLVDEKPTDKCVGCRNCEWDLSDEGDVWVCASCGQEYAP